MDHEFASSLWKFGKNPAIIWPKWVKFFGLFCFGEFLFYLLSIPSKVLNNKYGRIFEFLLWLAHNILIFQFFNLHMIWMFPLLSGFPIICGMMMSSSDRLMFRLSLRMAATILSILPYLMLPSVIGQLWNLREFLLPNCSRSSTVSSRYHICFWRSWLDSFAALSFCDSVMSYADWVSMVWVRFWNADCIALCSVGVIALVRTGTDKLCHGFELLRKSVVVSCKFYLRLQ